MQSVCVTKAKAYYIIADGYTECYTFKSREEAESFIELFKPFYKNKTVMIQEANVLTSYTRDILISKDEERFCPNILLGLLTGFYGVQKKPWQPEIGDVYFYVAVDEGRNKGVIHNETLFNKNNIKFLLLKKSGKYYKSYFEAEKHLKEDYEYLTGE